MGNRDKGWVQLIHKEGLETPTRTMHSFVGNVQLKHLWTIIDFQIHAVSHVQVLSGIRATFFGFSHFEVGFIYELTKIM